MPAESQAQQKFMGMVHALKKGELEHPSDAVKKAAASMSDKSAKDFASTPREGLPKHVDEANSGNIMEAIANYSKYGKAIKRTESMREIAEQLAALSEMAEAAVIKETEGHDWYDNMTIKRHMKEVKSYASDFAKCAEDADMLGMRMEALYEDMGRVLERYFDLANEAGGEDQDLLVKKIKKDNDREVDTGARFTDKDNVDVKEAIDTPEAGTSLDVVPIESPESEENVRHSARNMELDDEMSARAIKNVYDHLRKLGRKDLAEKFDKLPIGKRKTAAWRMIK